MSPARRHAAAIAASFVLALAAGCDGVFATKSPFTGIDVTGSSIGDDLRLADPEGRTRTLGEFRGKATVVVFGYTQCPDVCPTTMADIAAAVKKLGPDAKRVQVVFVTVDPQRDTAELLREYVPAFDPAFIGLRGDPAQTQRVTKDFHVYAQQRPGKTPDTYTVDHTAQSFVFDPQGRIRLVFGYGMTPEAMASDLRKLLEA